VMNGDGSGVRALPETLKPRGAPAWSPDGRSIAVAATVAGKPGLVRVAIDDFEATVVAGELAVDPVWSPDGEIVYSDAEIGTTFGIREAGGETKPRLTLSRGVRRLVFLPGTRELVVLRGDMVHKNFWAVDLDNGKERKLTEFGADFVIADFDVTPDGREIVFDREQEDSDVVVIER
jgi:Tol biopolymer transport system component